MSDNTGIEWTDATWNPVTGCTEVSPGCDHCYAKTFAERFRGVPGHHFERGFDVVLRPERLEQPLRWTRPRRIFVNSMSDLFHDEVPDEFIARVWAVMAAAHQHTFQVLTKRHGRMRSLLGSDRFLTLLRDAVVEQDRPLVTAWPLPNVWLGVSVENQQWADIRIPALLETPAAVRFLSCEPLLGPVDLGYAEPCDHTRYSCIEIGCWGAIDWVIVGGESGRGARPMHQEWARAIRDQCVAAGVAFHFKQWGEWAPQPTVAVSLVGPERGEHFGELVTVEEHPDHPWRRVYRRVGKRAAGRELDGRTWDEFPPAVTA